jgi:hypothetical protein
VTEVDRYLPPPPMNAPPTGWRPVRIVEPAPPRTLPPQNHAAIDADEARARELTRTFGIVAAVGLAVLLLLLCGRAIF